MAVCTLEIRRQRSYLNEQQAVEQEGPRTQHQPKFKGLEAHWGITRFSLPWKAEEAGDPCSGMTVAKDIPG